MIIGTIIRDGIIVFVRADMFAGSWLYCYLHLFDEFDYIRTFSILSQFALPMVLNKLWSPILLDHEFPKD